MQQTALTFLAAQIGSPRINTGTDKPARRAMPTGAPTSVPNCQSIFFFFVQGFLPQNVHPDGLK